jgi:beta-lactam-binding protein with PASTA domain
LSFEEAAAALADAGFQVGGPAGEFSDATPAGAVVRTDPPEESEQLPGTVIVVLTSLGPTPPAVPDVLLLGGQEAVARLAAAGYRATTTFEVSAEADGGLVVSQDPPGGSLVTPPETVHLGIGAPPVPPLDTTPPVIITE